MLSLSISSAVTQLFPPKPDFTEKNLPDLHGKLSLPRVYIITGSNTGLGKELAKILYSKNAKVYIVARAQEKAHKAIEDIIKTTPNSTGELVFLHLDLNDLTTIKASAEEFLTKETKLHVLFNNAGVMMPAQGSTTAQGYELQLGINNIGTFMFTKFLTPLLISTAKTEPPHTVRVIWVSSSAAELFSPKAAGVPMDNLDYHKNESAQYKYGVSKAGSYLYSVEFAKRYKDTGVISLALNPGNLRSDLGRHLGFLYKKTLGLVQYPTIFGAYTQLFAGLSPKVTIEKSGEWVAPFGRFISIRKDLIRATKPVEEGGTGVGQMFWEWTENQIGPYL